MSKIYRYEGKGEYVVGFLDVMGFEYLLNKHGIEIIKKSLERTFSLPKAYKEGKSNKFYQFYDSSTGGRFSIGEVKQATQEILKNGMFNFSDSVIIFGRLKNNNEGNAILLGYICRLVNLFLSKPILNPHKENQIPFPFRAGISFGKGYVDKKRNFHLGKPFVRAYKLAEIQNWVGGVLDKSEFIKPEMMDEIYGYNNEVIEHDIPFSESKVDEFKINIDELNYALNWPQMHPYDHSLGEFHRDGPKYSDLKYHICNHDWNNEDEKRRKTLNFAKHICEEWDERYCSIVKSYLIENEEANTDEIWSNIQNSEVAHSKDGLKEVLDGLVKKGEVVESGKGVYQINNG